MSQLSTHNLTVRFGSSDVLRNISVHFQKGDFIGVVGSNGSGKSTLLKTLTGLLKPKIGSVLLNEKNIETLSRFELAQRISYLPQKISVLYPITVKDFILLGRYPHIGLMKSFKKNDFEIVDLLMSKLNVSHIQNRFFDTLSGGEQQRVLIASALAQEASLLLLDEPDSFLDPKQKNDFFECLHTINKDLSIGIVIASHDFNHLKPITKRIIALSHGTILFDGTTQDFFQNGYEVTTYEQGSSL